MKTSFKSYMTAFEYINDFKFLPKKQKQNTTKKLTLKRAMLFLEDSVCHYCKIPLNFSYGTDQQKRVPRYATLDHVIPKAKGGNNTMENLVICCRKCNQLKADKLINH